ncbi:hypothetical protein ACFQ3W_14600 [Paenibacillus puldeungensis]|uniref:Uncharacterized protein n=1 Tax=Paenibacillus puldeungensis TaxID=696536 RepID=A0ABW3S066_9BACL
MDEKDDKRLPNADVNSFRLIILFLDLHHNLEARFSKTRLLRLGQLCFFGTPLNPVIK